MRALALGAVFVLALLVTLGTMACGSEEAEPDLSLTEYFERLGGITDEVDTFLEDTDNAVSEAVRAATSMEERIAAYRGHFHIRVAFAGYVRDQLDSMEPPAAVEDVHSDFAAAVTKMGDNFEDLLERTEGTDARLALRELRVGMNTSEFRAKCERFESACLELQDIATASGIEINLECQEDRYR